MPATHKFILKLIPFFQACFAGVLLGQLLNLFFYQEPGHWIFYVTVGILLCQAFFLYRFKKQFQLFLFRSFSFNWLHFFSSILYATFLFLFLFPVYFQFEENPMIVMAVQLSSLVALGLVIAETIFLQFGPMQQVYTQLLQLKKTRGFISYWVYLLALALFTCLSLLLNDPSPNSFLPIVHNTLYMGVSLFLLLLSLKIALMKKLASFNRNGGAGFLSDQAGQSLELKIHKSYFYLEQNLTEILLQTNPEERYLIYAKIRQIPLVDKIEELTFIHNKYLPKEEELTYTLHFLRRLHQELLEKRDHFDIDTSSNLLEIKASIRTVILEGNPMLVQKLLNDSRPEVKKAAIFATVHFQEASLIPALVDLLKTQEFAFSAKEALFELGDQCLPFLRSAKYRNKNNSFFVEHCLELVESYKSDEARAFLVEMLNEPQKRFQYKAAVALLKNDYPLSSLHKVQILHFIESIIATIAIQRGILCKLANSNEELCAALLEEEAEKKGLLLNLLEAFLPKQLLSLVQSLLEKEGNQIPLYALIDLHFPLVLRAKCKILFGSSAEENFAPGLQAEYLQEQIHFYYANQNKAIRQILKMDYGQIGYWLRVCAIKQLARTANQQPSMQLLAEVFNKNPLLQEAACDVLYDLNYDYYFLYMQRLPIERAKALKHKIETGKISDKKATSAVSQLLYDQILFMRSLPFFKDCSYEKLARTTELFSLVPLDKAKKKLNFDPYRPNGYWIVYQGAFMIYYRGEELLSAKKGDIIDMSFLTEAEKQVVSIQPKNTTDREEDMLQEEILVYFVEYSSFNKLYLKTGNLKGSIFQPKLNHSEKLHLA